MRDRRFRLIVSPFQYKLLRRVFLYWLIYQLSLWNFLFFWRLLAEGKGDPFAQYVRFFQDFYPMLFCFALVVPFFAWDAMRLTHRVVGPLNRFRRAMREIAAGESVRLVRLREGDELDDMQRDFNAMLEALERRGALQLIHSSPAVLRQQANAPTLDASNQAEGADAQAERVSLRNQDLPAALKLREDRDESSDGRSHPSQTA